MTYNENAWAPLVFARTYAVDYHVIAAPKPRQGYFDEHTLARAVQFIQGTFETFTPRDGQNPLRWSVVKTRKYCMVGITCMVSQLPTDKREDEKDRTGLQAFLGYVCQSDFILTKVLPELQVDPFSQLYRWVEKHWEDNARQARIIDESDYTSRLPIGNLDYQWAMGWFINSNEKQKWGPGASDIGWDKTWVFRATGENNSKLWTIASQMDEPTSLCLGLSAKRIAQNGPFLNATALDCNRPLGEGEVLLKPQQPSVPHYQNQRPPEQGRSRPTEAVHHSTFPTPSLPKVPSFRDVRKGVGGMLSDLGRALGGEDEFEPGRRIEGSLYEQDKQNRGGAGGKSEQHQGPIPGFKPKQPGKDTEEGLPDPFASASGTKSPSRFSESDVHDRGSDGLLSGFKLKQPGQDAEEVLPDPFAEPPRKKQKTGELPFSTIKDVKSSQELSPPNRESEHIENSPTEPLPGNDVGNA